MNEVERHSLPSLLTTHTDWLEGGQIIFVAAMTWLPGIKGTIQVKDQRSLDLLKFEMTEKIKFQKQQNHEDQKLGPLSDR